MAIRAVAASVVLLSLLVHANSLGNGFVLDDGDLVETNPWIRDLGNWPRLLSSDYWEPTLRGGLYRPLTTLSYAASVAWGGDSPESFRALNLVLHALNALLVWWLARRVLASEWLAAGAAGLFAVHAVHVEAVVGITAGRPELLAALFFLAALMTYVQAQDGRRFDRRRYAVSLVCFALALLAKESAVTLIGILVLYDVSFCDPTRRADGLARSLFATLRERFGSRYLAYGLVVLGYLGARWLALRDGELLPPRVVLDNPLVELGLAARITEALEVAWRYVGLLILPLRLSHDYSYDQIRVTPALDAPDAIAVLATALALVLWLVSYRRSPRAFFAAGLFLIPFSLVSNVVVPIGTILGERLLYVPSIGFCLIVALGVARLVELATRDAALRRVGLAVGLGLVILLHAARTLDRNRDWQSARRLYLHDLEVVPRSAKVHANAAFTLALWGRYEEAIALYRRAIEIGPPDHVQPYKGLGFLLTETGALREGIALLEQAVRMAPEDPAVRSSLAYAYHRSGRQAEALEAIETALRLHPESPEVEKRRALKRQIEAARR